MIIETVRLIQKGKAKQIYPLSESLNPLKEPRQHFYEKVYWNNIYIIT